MYSFRTNVISFTKSLTFFVGSQMLWKV